MITNIVRHEMVVTLKSILENKDTKKFRVHMVEHLVEHETPCPLLDRSKKHVFFTFTLHFLLPNLIV